MITSKHKERKNFGRHDFLPAATSDFCRSRLLRLWHRSSVHSFDRGDFHFVVLDACFRNDGEPYGRKNSKWNDANIPAAELEWLQA
ncbi:MAG: hypothetical protein K9M08_23390, partial [Pirellula sp.]|nr:hypothetical protein [Pirellula sp.]